MKLLVTIAGCLSAGLGFAQGAPDWAGTLGFDLRAHQFAALTSTTLRSIPDLIGIKGLDVSWIAFGGSTLQLGKARSAGIVGTGTELMYSLPDIKWAPHLHFMADAGIGQGFRAGSAGSDWVVWVGAAVRF